MASCAQVHAQQASEKTSAPDAELSRRDPDSPSSNVLPPEEWQRLDQAVDRSLAWLATQQNSDGSFPTASYGQPGVTSLCLLAFMANGHVPGEGPYGNRLDKATRFIMSCQKQNGLVTLNGPDGEQISRDVDDDLGVTAAYNHAISSLTLSETYGMARAKRAPEHAKIIDKALAATLEMQHWKKDLKADLGGWRYIIDEGENDSDLSITGWQLMFLRSARNAGFNVPQEPIDDAIKYVRRTFRSKHRTFGYETGQYANFTRAMAGAGILALAHAGYHNSIEARTASEWLLENTCNEYNGSNGVSLDRYHYSLFNSCQGMYQMGSPYWDKFFPPTVASLLAHQNPDGSWDAESLQRDRRFGNSYTTSLVALSLAAPNQFLPIFQR